MARLRGVKAGVIDSTFSRSSENIGGVVGAGGVGRVSPLQNREIYWEGCAFQNCQWSGTTAKPPRMDLRRVLESALLSADCGLTSQFYTFHYFYPN